MRTIGQDELRARLDAGEVVLVDSDVRVYPGGKADWADAGLPFEGSRAQPKAVA